MHHNTLPPAVVKCYGISAAFDVTVASTLNSSTITEAGMYSGAAARAAELRKHTQNDSKCAEPKRANH